MKLPNASRWNLQFKFGDGTSYGDGEGCGYGFGPSHDERFGHGFLRPIFENPLVLRWAYTHEYPTYLVIKHDIL